MSGQSETGLEVFEVIRFIRGYPALLYTGILDPRMPKTELKAVNFVKQVEV